MQNAPDLTLATRVNSPPDQKPLRILGGIILTAMLAALGVFMVPAHWNSIWMDTGFGGWVAPVANRITADVRLYDFGLHSPMPPLSFVLTRVLHPDGAIWLHESLLNFLFQAGTILMLYWAFARRMGVALAFASALAVVPVFFSLNKAILYDSMAQFLVACVGVTAVACREFRAREDPGAAKRLSGRLFLLALLLALLWLTKQSTGAGATLGAVVLLMLRPRAGTPDRRLSDPVLLAASTLVAGVAILGLLSPWVNVWNCIQDVILTGSQPKGGLKVLISSIGWVLMETAVVLGLTAFAAVIFHLSLGHRWPQLRPGPSPPTAAEPAGLVLGASTVAALAGFFALWWYASIGGSGAIIQGFHLDSVGMLALNVSLLLLCLRVGAFVLWEARRNSAPQVECCEVQFAIVFLCAALGHNLSAVVLRWSHDNNPLIFSALVLLMKSCVRPLPTLHPDPRLQRLLSPAATGLLILALFVPFSGMVSMVAHCTERWPEVRHLQGARLRPEAASMRELVRTIRALVPGQSTEQVVLLPGDPAVEAWFERKRPQLSSAILFVDQYWDRYVESDFARLNGQPPKVMVIGPRNYWRRFGWHWRKQWGAERLIDLVQQDLLPERYELHKAQEIRFRGGTDFLDIYVRKEQAP